ncbi:unnamed protein product, partial [Ectocarpus sp. 4 AP-2014]
PAPLPPTTAGGTYHGRAGRGRARAVGEWALDRAVAAALAVLAAWRPTRGGSLPLAESPRAGEDKAEAVQGRPGRRRRRRGERQRRSRAAPDDQGRRGDGAGR